MNGYRLTFYTQQGRTHNHMSIAEWLLREAKAIGVEGATFAAARLRARRQIPQHAFF